MDLRRNADLVRALAVEGDRVVSGSFDNPAIVWEGSVARQVTQAHAGTVTAVLPLPDGRFSTGRQPCRQWR